MILIQSLRFWLPRNKVVHGLVIPITKYRKHYGEKFAVFSIVSARLGSSSAHHFSTHFHFTIAVEAIMSAWLITRLCNHSNCVSQRVSRINMNEVLHWNSSLPSKKKYCQKHVHFLSMETEISNYSYAALLNGWFCHIGEMCFQILAYEIQVSQKENNKNGRHSKCCNILLEADYVVTSGDGFMWSF